jgi:predicted MPP superfamily phosphohydrolase
MVHYILFSAAAAAFAVCAFWHGLVLRRYEVLTDRLSGASIRAVHLSDLHSTAHGKKQQKLLSAVKEAEPDIIFLTGDIVDDRKERTPAFELFEGICALGVPVYYVTGNHETNICGLEAVKDEIRNFGVRILDGECENIVIKGVRLNICGISDPRSYDSEGGYDGWESAMKSAFADIKDSHDYNILLSHRPEKIGFYHELGFDAVFCGHAHGGQVRIPLILNGLFSPHQGLFPKYAGGIYSMDKLPRKTFECVSRGLSIFWNLLRVFNPPEVVVTVINKQ